MYKLINQTIRNNAYASIFQGDHLSLLPSLKDSVVDLCITSPPYDDMRAYEGYIFNFEQLALCLYRVIKPGGIVVWVTGDQTIKGSETGSSFQQALYFKSIGFKLFDTMLYAKNNPMPNGHNRYLQAFQYMFVFSKGTPKCFNGIREPVKWDISSKPTFRQKYGELIPRMTKPTRKTKLRSNIWYYSVGSNQGDPKLKFSHPATFPDKLAEDHILTWTNPGDLVLDPMCGSGTVNRMALKNARNSIGIDISLEYCNLAAALLAP